MFTQTIQFIRQEDGEVTSTALVKFRLNKKMTREQIIDVLKNLITEWIKTTVRGKEAWIYSGNDFNIGDLASYEHMFCNWLPHSKLTKTGIVDFEFLECGDTGSMPFDTVLAHPNEINLCA
jgi:hypothetical protein